MKMILRKLSIVVTVFLLASQSMWADDRYKQDTTYYTVNGRTLVEKKVTGEHLLMYHLWIDDMKSYVDSVKQIRDKESGSEEPPFYPHWRNGEPYDDDMAFKEHVKKIFHSYGKKQKDLKALQLLSLYCLLENNGHITVSSLTSKRSLLNVFTPEEAVDIIERINMFRYKAPVFREDGNFWSSFVLPIDRFIEK